MILNVDSGETINRSIRVINDNEVSLNITLFPSGDFEDEINIIDENFILNPGDEKNARFNLKLEEPGKYEGRINVKFSPIGTKESGVGLASQITINVHEENGVNVNGGDNESNSISSNKTAVILMITTLALFVMLSALVYMLKIRGGNKRGEQNIIKKIIGTK